MAHDHTTLADDLATMLKSAASRRQSLRWLLAGAAAIPLAGCGGAAAGAAVYLWHCTREGGYSMHSNGIVNENYLRGVQEADSQGVVTFQTIFPGCYDGRMPHAHFEVYPTLAKAGSASNRVKTSQFTFPLATMNEAYASSGYSTSVSKLARISFATDNVFSVGTALQMASVTGNATQGYVATLTVGVSL